MPPPLPRRSAWAPCFAHSPSRISLPRKGGRVGLRIVLFEACSAFTHVAACTLALSPIRDTLIEGFSHFVTSVTAPIASGWSGCRVGLAPTGKRRLSTAHTQSGHAALQSQIGRSPQSRKRLTNTPRRLKGNATLHNHCVAHDLKRVSLQAHRQRRLVSRLSRRLYPH